MVRTKWDSYGHPTAIYMYVPMKRDFSFITSKQHLVDNAQLLI